MLGDIIHDALDVIVSALTASGRETVRSAEAVAVMRALGGYTAVIETAAAKRLAALAGNPRAGSLKQFRDGHEAARMAWLTSAS